MNLGRRIQDTRISAGMTQSSLAEAALTNQTTISAIERGVNDFAKEKLQFVVDYLDMDVTDSEVAKWHKLAHEPRKEPEDVAAVQTTGVPEKSVERLMSGKASAEIQALRKEVAFYKKVFSKLSAGDDSYRDGLLAAVEMYDELLEGAGL